MIIIYFVVLLTLLFFYNFVWKRKNLPPGPTPLPLLGNGITLKRLAPGYEAFQQWSKQYGPIFTFWLAEEPVVAVTDFDLMKETFINNGDATSGRDFYRTAFEIMCGEHGLHGVLRTEGQEWFQLSRFSLKLLRHLGVGRDSMEKKIMLEVNSVIETINDDLKNATNYSKEGYNMSQLIDIAVGSIINQLVFGFRFVGDSLENFYKIKTAMDHQVQSFMHPVGILVMTMPWLRYFPIFSYYFKEINDRFDQVHEYFDSQIHATIERRKKEAESCATKDEEDTYFIHAFLQEIEQRKDLNKYASEDPYFNLHTLRGLCSDLFVAGQETTSNTLKFLILYMVLFPEVQTKMQEELDRVIGDNEKGSKRIGVADKAGLPYTNAETQRLCNLLPLNLIHRTTKDVECGGFKIAAGIKIVPLISCVLYDEKIFPNPQEFMPERFIKDGQLRKCEELIPFSIGKRQCMGESLARAELFLFTANLFYLYKLRTLGQVPPPSMEKRPGLIVAPKDFVCIIEKRTQNIMYE